MNANDGVLPRSLRTPATPRRRSDCSPVRLKLDDVAQILGVSVITVRRRIGEGALGHVRIAGRLYVRPQDLEAFVARYHVPGR